MQFYDETDVPVGKEIDLANYGGDPIAGSYKVYTIPLADFGVVGKKVSDIHLQNYTDIAQPVLYVDRFGLTSSTVALPTATPMPTVAPTAVPTSQPTPTVAPTAIPIPTVLPTSMPTPTVKPTVIPTATPAPVSNLIQNASYETGLTPWHIDVQTGATATMSQDTTTASEGQASVKVNVTKANSGNTWYVQLAQDTISLVSGKQYTVSFGR